MVLLWLLVFLHQLIIGRRILSAGRSKIYGGNLDHLGPDQQLLIDLGSCLLGPVMLHYQRARVARQIRASDQKFKLKVDYYYEFLGSQSLIELSTSWQESFKDLQDLMEGHEELMARQRQLDRLLATSYKSEVMVESTPQILCQLLIVFVSGSTLSFPGAVGWLGQWREALLVVYLSLTWSKKLSASYLLKQKDTVSLQGQLLVCLRSFLEVWSRLMTLFLYWAPFFRLFSSPQRQTSVNGSSPQLVEGAAKNGLPDVSFQEYFILLITVGAAHVGLVSLLKILLTPDFLQNLKANIVTGNHLRQIVWNLYAAAIRAWRRLSALNRRQLVSRLHSAAKQACGSLIASTPARDWDKKPRKASAWLITRKDFQRNWQANRREYVAMEVLHLLENLLLMGWCWFRHASPLSVEESWNYYSVAVLTSPVWLVVLALCKVGLYELYNRQAHPWSRLLQPATPTLQDLHLD